MVRGRHAASDASGDVTRRVQVEVLVTVRVRAGDRIDLFLTTAFQPLALGEDSLSVVPGDQQIRPRSEDQVLIAIPVEVHDHDARSVVEKVHACLARGVAHRPVGLVVQQAIGHTGLMTDIDVLETVAVEVSDRHAVHAQVDIGETGRSIVPLFVLDAPHVHVALEVRLTLQYRGRPFLERTGVEGHLFEAVRLQRLEQHRLLLGIDTPDAGPVRIDLLATAPELARDAQRQGAFVALWLELENARHPHVDARLDATRERAAKRAERFDPRVAPE